MGKASLINAQLAYLKTMSELLGGKDCNVIKATTAETGKVLFLHGLGDSGFGYPSYLGECCAPHVTAVCPTTSVKPVSVNNGYRMPSWFDVFELKNNKEREDEASLRTAVSEIHQALDELISSGTPSNRIVLGGISQGGCLATFAAITYKHPLAGVLLLSAWLPIKDRLHKEVSEVNKSTPILQCHGEADPLIVLKSAHELTQFFRSQNFNNLTFKEYPGVGHTIDITQELPDIKEWLLKVLP